MQDGPPETFPRLHSYFKLQNFKHDIYQTEKLLNDQEKFKISWKFQRTVNISVL